MDFNNLKQTLKYQKLAKCAGRIYSCYMRMKFNNLIRIYLLVIVAIAISACSDDSVIYENDADLEAPYTIMLNEVKIASETNDSLTVDFIYTYKHEIPPEEIKLFVLPDHGYWQTSDVKIFEGKHGAKARIGLSNSNMQKDEVTESDTTKLRFRFDHYLPKKYMGNIWGQDVEYKKHWRKSI